MTTSASFKKELERMLNAHSMEDASGTPDFILAEYMFACLRAFEAASNDRSSWYGHKWASEFGSRANAPADDGPSTSSGVSYAVPPWEPPSTVAEPAAVQFEYKPMIGECRMFALSLDGLPKGWRWLDDGSKTINTGYPAVYVG